MSAIIDEDCDTDCETVPLTKASKGEKKERKPYVMTKAREDAIKKLVDGTRAKNEQKKTDIKQRARMELGIELNTESRGSVAVARSKLNKIKDTEPEPEPLAKEAKKPKKQIIVEESDTESEEEIIIVKKKKPSKKVKKIIIDEQSSSDDDTPPQAPAQVHAVRGMKSQQNKKSGFSISKTSNEPVCYF